MFQYSFKNETVWKYEQFYQIKSIKKVKYCQIKEIKMKHEITKHELHDDHECPLNEHHEVQSNRTLQQVE